MVETTLGMPPPPKKHQLFGKQKQAPDVSGMTADINNVSRRLRLLEESFTNMRRTLQVTEENMLSKHKTFVTEIKTINSEIRDMRNEITDVKDKILMVIRELKTSAKRDEVKVLEKYINLWNPVKFVTQNEVEAMIKDLIQKNK
jgi:chromosome segregation ATPase